MPRNLVPATARTTPCDSACRSSRSPGPRVGLACGLLVAGLGLAAMPAAAQPAGEWRYFGGDEAFTRYSSLDRIGRVGATVGPAGTWGLWRHRPRRGSPRSGV